MFIDACCTLGIEQELHTSARLFLREMETIGVEQAVIHPPDAFFAWYNEAWNDFALKFAQKYPSKFIPTATVNPWRTDSGEVAAKYLINGVKMLIFAPGAQGFTVSSDKILHILESINKKNLNPVIYIHCGHHSHAAPSQLALLAQRFPQFNFIMGHCGATDYHNDLIPTAQICRNIYFESSFARPASFVEKMQKIGFERAIMGSGFPHNNLSLEWSHMRRLLPDENKKSVLGGNLEKLLEGCHAG